MRHLIEFDVKANLRNGRTVEQLLPGRIEAGETIIRHLSIHRTREGEWMVEVYEVYDDGPDFMDLYEFSSVDPDMPAGEEPTFASVEDALAYCSEQLGARPDRYVNLGLVSEEYRDRYHPDAA
ncbi:hypothetical protein [Stenotrophomonas sp.]|uniref:hypothetical protein n=1 Tax=Stenotrophomonas sp. TaxID=69392 RepID=UPI002FCACDC2